MNIYIHIYIFYLYLYIYICTSTNACNSANTWVCVVYHPDRSLLLYISLISGILFFVTRYLRSHLSVHPYIQYNVSIYFICPTLIRQSVFSNTFADIFSFVFLFLNFHNFHYYLSQSYSLVNNCIVQDVKFRKLSYVSMVIQGVPLRVKEKP